MIIEILRGQTILRTMMNERLRKIDFREPILDIGASKVPLYHEIVKGLSRESVGYDGDYKYDLEKGLPINNGNYKTILMLNIIEHLYNEDKLLLDIREKFKEDTDVVIFMPFLFKVHNSPKDYKRYTSQMLKKKLEEFGYRRIKIETMGVGAFVAGYSQMQHLFPKYLRLFSVIIYLSCHFADNCISYLTSKKIEEYPLGYFVLAKVGDE